MKNQKKAPKKQLEKYSVVFMQLSLVLVLFIVYQVIEYETVQKKFAIHITYDPDEIYGIEPAPINYTKEVIQKKIARSKVKPIQTIIKVEIVDNNMAEIISSKLPVIDNINVKQGKMTSSISPTKNEQPIEKEANFIHVEDAPIFKGCEGLSKEENKKCFTKKISKFIISRFNIDLAQDLGLESGKHKIFTQFVINKEGDITDVKIRAPHKRLEKEVKRIVDKIPQFVPGMQRKKPVKVRYTLPISFNVE